MIWSIFISCLDHSHLRFRYLFFLFCYRHSTSIYPSSVDCLYSGYIISILLKRRGFSSTQTFIFIISSLFLCFFVILKIIQPILTKKRALISFTAKQSYFVSIMRAISIVQWFVSVCVWIVCQDIMTEQQPHERRKKIKSVLSYMSLKYELFRDIFAENQKAFLFLRLCPARPPKIKLKKINRVVFIITF